MKKLIAYMLLALVVYILFYAVILAFKRMSGEDTRDFCEALEPGMSLEAIEALASQKNLEGAINDLPDNQGQMFFVRDPGSPEAVCQGIIEDSILKEKKYSLSVF